MQAYRGIAALLVLVSHTQNICEKYFPGVGSPVFFRLGQTGVQFFFVLSGFVLFWAHQPDFGRPDRMGGYLRNRIVRIYPAYIFVTLALLPFWKNRGILSLFESLALFPQENGTHLPVGWSLQYEALFYLAFSVLLVRRRIGSALFAGWAAAVVAAEIRGWNGSFPADFFFNPLNLLFPLGILAGLAARRWTALEGKMGLMVFWSGNLLALVVIFRDGTLFGSLDSQISYGLAFSLVAAGSVSARVQAFFQGGKILLFLGAASYSIYLIHYPALSAAAKLATALGLGNPLPPAAVFLLLGASALAPGILLYVLMERPVLALLRRPPSVSRA